jgi:hypothetical protein
MLIKTIQPLVIQNLFIAQSFPLKSNLRKIDFKIIKCLISDHIIPISEISKIVSFSTKTVNKRIANMKDNSILTFIVATDPLKMKGCIRFGIFIQSNANFNHRTLRHIQDTLERNFDIAMPMIYYKDLIDYQIITRNIFEIDQTIE